MEKKKRNSLSMHGLCQSPTGLFLLTCPHAVHPPWCRVRRSANDRCARRSRMSMIWCNVAYGKLPNTTAGRFCTSMKVLLHFCAESVQGRPQWLHFLRLSLRFSTSKASPNRSNTSSRGRPPLDDGIKDDSKKTREVARSNTV